MDHYFKADLGPTWSCRGCSSNWATPVQLCLSLLMCLFSQRMFLAVGSAPPRWFIKTVFSTTVFILHFLSARALRTEGNSVLTKDSIHFFWSQLTVNEMSKSARVIYGTFIQDRIKSFNVRKTHTHAFIKIRKLMLNICNLMQARTSKSNTSLLTGGLCHHRTKVLLGSSENTQA